MLHVIRVIVLFQHLIGQGLFPALFIRKLCSLLCSCDMIILYNVMFSFM